jgi:hypothetical protein
MRKKLLFPVLFLVLTILILFSIPSFVFAEPIVLHTPIYVNGATGNDGWDGTSPTFTTGKTGPKAKIIAGIGAVSDGGIVYVADGTYNENLVIELSSKTISIVGTGSSKPIIDGNGIGSVIKVSHGTGAEDDLLVLRNLAINNGSADWGGGIRSSIHLEVYDCNIYNNHASIGGGGIYSNNNTLIDGCNISNNRAASGVYGGGIYFTNGSANATLTITDSIISNNSAGDPGSGIFGWGGGIYNIGGIIEITGSQIINNSAASRGGGIYHTSINQVTIHNSSIANNTAPEGAGIYDSSTTTVYAQNNWWGTSTGPGGNINDPDTGKLANGSGNTIFGHVFFDSWLTYDPFALAAAAGTLTEPVWIRTLPMTCYRVWINEDNKFQFIFWYPYRDNNWVRIFDMSGKIVYEIDMPYDNPNLIVDLPGGEYTVKTFNIDKVNPIQTFVIGKP